MNHYKIDNTDVFIDEIDTNKGKITISNTSGHNYSTSWGAMGGTLKEFLCKINEEYFADNLMGRRAGQVMDVKKTFTSVRYHITNEIGLPWYEYKGFQKEMRELLSSFQRDCEEGVSDRYFVDNFHNAFIDRLNFHFLPPGSDYIEERFKSINEPWNFIQHKESDGYIWLKKLHGKIKKQLLKEK